MDGPQKGERATLHRTVSRVSEGDARLVEPIERDEGVSPRVAEGWDVLIPRAAGRGREQSIGDRERGVRLPTV